MKKKKNAAKFRICLGFLQTAALSHFRGKEQVRRYCMLNNNKDTCVILISSYHLGCLSSFGVGKRYSQCFLHGKW